MGETGDPRFTEAIARPDLREPNTTVVRKRAFAALGSIRAATGRPLADRKWRLPVAGRCWGRAGRSRGVLLLAVAADGFHEPPQISTQQLHR